MAQLKSTSRDNILDAAQRVASREGAGKLTLDKVACECGLSKGGLLYNYPNKEALLKSMLDRLLEQFLSIAMCILTASAENPELLEPMRAVFRDSYQRISAECTDPDLGLLLWSAADGILFHHILGIAPYPQAEKSKLFQKLLQLSEEMS